MITITLVSPMDCPNCERVKETIERLKTKYTISIQQVDAYSLEGERLAVHHGILVSPGVFVNGEFIGMGNVPPEKIESRIKELSTYNKADA